MEIGIDIAQKTFDALFQHEQAGQKHETFDNQRKGFEGFVKWLKAAGVQEAHICMEATNVYWEALAEFLHEQGYTVSVVNPARIAGYAQSQLRRTKTDKVDSAVIRDFCASQRPARWTPPTPTQKQLRSLERHREDLQKTLTQQQNRLTTASEPLVRQSLQRILDTLQAEIAQVDQQLQALIAQSPALNEQLQLLTSIKSLGPRTATKLMAEMYDLAAYDDAPAAAADAGLTPAKHESGTSVRKKPKLCKVGKAAVRAALYLPAMSAIRHNPIVRRLAERLRSRGKSEMVILGAAMRKLLHLAYGVLKHKQPFDPNYAHPSLQPT